LYIHIQDDARLGWASVATGSEQPQQLSRGGWQDLPEVAEGTRVTVFVPATEVLLSHIKLPSRNRRQLLHAAPYALEDQLIDEVENCHVALGATNEQGQTAVAVVGRAQLDDWLARLRERHIEPDVLLSEAQAVPLPADDNAWSLLQLPQRCVLRTAANSGYGLDAANLPVFVDRIVASEGAPAGLDVIRCNGATAALATALPQTQHDCPGDALNSLIAGCRQGPAAINLLQGSYARKRPWLSGTRRWWPAAAMLLIWIVLQAGIVISDVWRLSSEESRLRADIEDTFRAAVPGVQRVVDARVQMQQELDRLRGSGSDTDFLALLGSAGKLFAQTGGLELQRLAYRDGVIDVLLVLTDLQGLDKLKQGLVEQAGLEVDVQSATPKDKLLEANLRIRRRP
jgi:general secretion pathway protein L